MVPVLIKDDFVFSGPLLQLMYGCQLSHNGTSSGLYHFSVNGEYSLSMDMDSPQWYSYLPQDLDIKNILDRFDLWYTFIVIVFLDLRSSMNTVEQYLTKKASVSVHV